MSSRADDFALRREMLLTRAAVQRLQLSAVRERFSSEGGALRIAAASALSIARWLTRRSVAQQAARTTAPALTLIAAWRLLRRMLRRPSGGRLIGAAVIAGVAWWAVSAMRVQAPDD